MINLKMWLKPPNSLCTDDLPAVHEVSLCNETDGGTHEPGLPEQDFNEPKLILSLLKIYFILASCMMALHMLAIGYKVGKHP